MDVQINYDYREDDLKDMPLVELAQFVLNHQRKQKTPRCPKLRHRR